MSFFPVPNKACLLRWHIIHQPVNGLFCYTTISITSYWFLSLSRFLPTPASETFFDLTASIASTGAYSVFCDEGGIDCLPSTQPYQVKLSSSTVDAWVPSQNMSSQSWAFCNVTDSADNSTFAFFKREYCVTYLAENLALYFMVGAFFLLIYQAVWPVVLWFCSHRLCPFDVDAWWAKDGPLEDLQAKAKAKAGNLAKRMKNKCCV